MKRTLPILLILFALSASTLWAQRTRILRDDLRTLRCEVDGVLTRHPILTLGSTEQVTVHFDQMTHKYHRFVYRVEHCDIDGQPSASVFPSETLDALQELTLIEDHTVSRNTHTLYTHYAFQFPNAEVRPLLSGNYRITIFEDQDETLIPVAEIFLGMVDPLVNVGGSLTTDTDIDRYEAHQQLNLTINAAAIPEADLRRELMVRVVQNNRFDDAVHCPTPSFINGTTLRWEHCRELIFPAGNEYRHFEMLTTRRTGMRIERMEWYAPYFHATLMTDEPARNYLLLNDRDGTSVVRNVDNQDANTESEYAFVHFTLLTPEVPGAEVYIEGAWTTGADPEWRMDYNAERGAYEASLFLKQGYYNYRYLTRTSGQRPLRTAPMEGDFFQTSNTYTVLVYRRSPQARHDALIGVATLRS